MPARLPPRSAILKRGYRRVVRRKRSTIAKLDAVALHAQDKYGALMFREEITRLFTVGERHRRLLARLVLALVLTSIVFLAGTLLIWTVETGEKGGQINGLGDAAFFTGTQLLTVSSSITNPVTTAGKIIDIVLEVWAIFIVTAVAGSFATFFSSGDST